MPSLPWNVEYSKIFKKIIISKFQKCPKVFPKVSKRVLNVFWGKLFEKFLPSFPWKVESSKIFKKIKKVSNFLKCPKSFPKVSKRVLNVFWGKLFEKFLPSFPWKVESSKIFKKIKKIAKFQKCPKSFPKASKRVLNLFWVKFFEIFFCPVFRGGSSFRKFSKKKFKFPKMPKSNTKSIQTCFERVLGQTFRKIFDQFSMEYRVSENFRKKIFSKFRKRSKVFPKVSKRVLW